MLNKKIDSSREFNELVQYAPMDEIHEEATRIEQYLVAMSGKRTALTDILVERLRILKQIQD